MPGWSAEPQIKIATSERLHLDNLHVRAPLISHRNTLIVDEIDSRQTGQRFDPSLSGKSSKHSEHNRTCRQGFVYFLF